MRRRQADTGTAAAVSEDDSRAKKDPMAITRSKLPSHRSNDRSHLRASFCCRRLLLAMLLAITAFGVALVASNDFSVARTATTVNFFLMKFFRDLSRAKARRRRFGQEGALMSVLLQREEPLPLGDASAGLALTAEELAEFDGRLLPDSNGERAPLLLAIRGRIYDVSAGSAFYGPGRPYHKLVGKDATRAFCTGCLEPACLISNTQGLSDKQLKEAVRWIELYEHHDKYKLVGQLRLPDASVEAAEGMAEEGSLEEERKRVAEARAAYEQELLERAQRAESSRTFRPFRLR